MLILKDRFFLDFFLEGMIMITILLYMCVITNKAHGTVHLEIRIMS